MKRFRLLLAMGCLAMGAMSVQAAATLDFSNGGTAGGIVTVVGSGSSQYITGSGIPITGVGSGIGLNATPLNPGVTLPIFSGVLSFQTGTFSGTSGIQSIYGPGGYLTITGGITSLGLGGSTVLLNAVNIQAAFQPTIVCFPNCFNILNITIPFGVDVKDPRLVSYFFGNQTPTWIFAGTINSDPRGGGGLSADITNTAAVVPEPASLLLLGTAMIGVAVGLRRRKNSKVG